ncbi:MAG: hypothetical protein ABI155_11395 [Paralcaligenes sp.]
MARDNVKKTVATPKPPLPNGIMGGGSIKLVKKQPIIIKPFDFSRFSFEARYRGRKQPPSGGKAVCTNTHHLNRNTRSIDTAAQLI